MRKEPQWIAVEKTKPIWLVKEIWSDIDQYTAMYEGWKLAYSPDDGWFIQSYDARRFPARFMAASFVNGKADLGCDLHTRALIALARLGLEGRGVPKEVTNQLLYSEWME